jgi:hypothetical protein
LHTFCLLEFEHCILGDLLWMKETPDDIIECHNNILMPSYILCVNTDTSVCFVSNKVHDSMSVKILEP